MATHENDLIHTKNPTSEYFEVKWGGYSYGIAAGETRTFPRFIAEHFAKHLADQILLRKEKTHKQDTGKDKLFLNSRRERPLVIKSIIVGVYSYFQPQSKSNDPNAQVAQMVEQLNQPKKEPKPLDIGTVTTDKAMGELEDDEEDLPDHTLLEAVAEDSKPTQVTPAQAQLPGQTSIMPSKTKRSRAELFEEAKKLGLKPQPSMNNVELEEMIKKF